MSKTNLEKLFGVQYFKAGTKTTVSASPNDSYTYKTFLGKQEIDVEAGDSIWYLDKVGNKLFAKVENGPKKISSETWATVIRGYKVLGDKSIHVTPNTILPYVNACSTSQIFAPDRSGDPTLQLLRIPPYAAEQAHHIHSTVRVVYVLEGRGYSIVGMSKKVVKQELKPGMLVVLEKMAPHHFETENEWLTVLPLHVFSALPGNLESNHPMFNGTFMTNQGE
jgi:mannose-6-phosphate isomerase-like protein (cupin superfamily)